MKKPLPSHNLIPAKTFRENKNNSLPGWRFSLLFLMLLTVTLTTGALMAHAGITTKTHSTVVTRHALASNANLANMSVTGAYVIEPFSSPRQAYRAIATSGPATVTPTLSNQGATVTVNGMPVTSGTASAAIPLIVGTNTITVKVTAEDGITTKIYTVTVQRPPSSNSALSNLSLSNIALTPYQFHQGTTSYTSIVYSETTSTTVKATVADPTATIKVNGTAVTSGTTSAPIALNPGQNIITILVTAQNGSTTTYTVTITKRLTPLILAYLTNLTLSNGTLTPEFVDYHGEYTVIVPEGTSSISVTPTAKDSRDTIKVNGIVTGSGSASAPIPLSIGANTINIFVTSPYNYVTRTYTVTVTRPSVSNALLANLAISSGTLTPAFASGSTSYTASVTNATTSVNITPTTSDAAAKVTVNGTAVVSGSASAAIPLVIGSNTITTVVTAADGVTTKTYTITVTRPPSNNSGLQILLLFSVASSNNLTTSPVFNTGTADYTTEAVGSEIADMTVYTNASDPTATVTVNGIAVASSYATQIVPLTAGVNTITVVVTAQDGVTKTIYTVTVPRLPKASLSALELSNGALSPAFSASTTSYIAVVNNSITSVTVKPTKSDKSSSVTVNGVASSSGANSKSIPLAVGVNTIVVVITAADGVTKTTYTIAVTRATLAASTNSSLSNLTFDTGTLSPAFASGTNTYTLNIANTATNLIKLTPTVSYAYATIRIDGQAVASGSAFLWYFVGNGETHNVVVTSQDGTTSTTYKITIHVLPSTNANLIKLVLSSGTITPAFGVQTYQYTASVSNATSSITVTPTVNNIMSIMTVNGTPVASKTASQSIPLALGANTITTVVIAEDGVTTKTYTVTVNRALSPNANLIKLVLSSGTLSPAFGIQTYNYMASVSNATSSITVTPTDNNGLATNTVNGTPVASKTASQSIPLAVGANTINTVVTAPDGVTTKTYTVTVTREAMVAVNSVYAQQISSTTKPDSVQAVNDDILVHQAVSPNGDGLGDIFTIDGLANYPDNKISIITQSGALVYKAKGYSSNGNVFDGHSNINGKMQSPGTYYYLLDYKVGNVNKHKTGFLILKY